MVYVYRPVTSPSLTSNLNACIPVYTGLCLRGNLQIKGVTRNHRLINKSKYAVIIWIILSGCEFAVVNYEILLMNLLKLRS